MKKLLLVDDDAVVTRTYRDRRSAHGFQVNTAASGKAAMAILRAAKPDMVVLDLMMPDLSGVDVLKFIRSEPSLVATPVVVLTNAYLNDLGRQAAMIGVQKTLLKAQCSPSALMACIDELLERKRAPSEPAHMASVATMPPSPPTTAPPPPPRRTQRETPSAAGPTHAPAPAAQSAHAEGPTLRQVEKGEPGAKASADLLAHAPTYADPASSFRLPAASKHPGTAKAVAGPLPQVHSWPPLPHRIPDSPKPLSCSKLCSTCS
jgi:CheY-like chemotaxis protein